jgi:hypothetical protein
MLILAQEAEVGYQIEAGCEQSCAGLGCSPHLIAAAGAV